MCSYVSYMILSDSAMDENEGTAMAVDEVQPPQKVVPKTEKNGISDRLNAFKSVPSYFSCYDQVSALISLLFCTI